MTSFQHEPEDVTFDRGDYERLREEEYQAHREARDDARLDRKREHVPIPQKHVEKRQAA